MSAREPLGAVDPTRHFDFTPESSWEDVQSQYRRLVQRWHPDRHPPDTRAKAQAEFIEITTAFKRLRRHYGEHGRLPHFDPALPAPGRTPSRGAGAAGGPRGTPRPHVADFPTPGRPPNARTARLRAILRSPLTAVAAALTIALSLVILMIVLDGRLAAERRAQALSRAAERTGAEPARGGSPEREAGDGWGRGWDDSEP